MNALFVLLPAGATSAEVLDGRDDATLHLRTYPPATDGAHLLSLVRDARDPRATRWLRGMFTALAAGAGLGLLTNGVLAAVFGMFGGLLAIALPLGLFVGAFLGGFTAAMTGTHRAVDEVRSLAARCVPGAVLLQIAAADRTTLAAIATRCDAHAIAYELIATP